MKLTATIPGEKYSIESGSGSTYTILYAGCDGDENIGLWECNCRAAQFGHDCKHMRSFLHHIGTFDGQESQEGETFEI